ncbi:MAG: ATP-binding protease component, partial [Pseudomonadota bacterium]
MDHGSLTDNNGRKADFRNVVIIMTTNAGADTLAKNSMGFTNTKAIGDEMEAIKRLFTPEFRNRLDATISFAPLNNEVILKVVEKFLLELENQLHDKKVDIGFSQSLRDYLARKGFDPLMGARPMARLIQGTIRKALADELLFGKLVGGGKVLVDMDKDEKVLLVFDKDEPANKPKLDEEENALA